MGKGTSVFRIIFRLNKFGLSMISRHTKSSVNGSSGLPFWMEHMGLNESTYRHMEWGRKKERDTWL